MERSPGITNEPIRVHVHGSNVRNLSVYLSVSQASKNNIISYVFSSTKFEKRAEQVLPGSKGGGGKRKGAGGKGRKARTMYAHMNK
jgi:hypothetical protein